MTVKTTCTGCKTMLRLGAEMAGKKVRCPRCSTVVAVPEMELEEVVPEEVVPEDDAITSEPIVKPAKRKEGRVNKSRKRRHEDEADEGDSEYQPCPECGASGATRVKWTPWGSFYGPALFTHVRCPECGYAYNGNTGRSNIVPAIIFVTIPALLILGIIGLVIYMIMNR